MIPFFPIMTVIVAILSENRNKKNAELHNLFDHKITNALQGPLGDMDHVKNFVKSGLIRLSFPEPYAQSVAEGLSEEWMNVEETTSYAPWYVRWDQEPSVPRERGFDFSRTPSEMHMHAELHALLTQVDGFDDAYYDRLTADLLDGWMHRDELPRWDTHSNVAILRNKFGTKMLEAGWPRHMVESVCSSDEHDLNYLMGIEMPSASRAQEDAKRVYRVLSSMGFSHDRSLKIAEQTCLVSSFYPPPPGGKRGRGTWSKMSADPKRVRLQPSVQQELESLFKTTPHAPAAKPLSKFLSTDWMYGLLD